MNLASSMQGPREAQDVVEKCKAFAQELSIASKCDIDRSLKSLSDPDDMLERCQQDSEVFTEGIRVSKLILQWLAKQGGTSNVRNVDAYTSRLSSQAEKRRLFNVVCLGSFTCRNTWWLEEHCVSQLEDVIQASRNEGVKKRIAKMLSTLLALHCFGRSYSQRSSFRFIKVMVDRIIRTPDINALLSSLGKWGRFAKLVYESQSMEARTWRAADVPMQACLYAAKCFEGRYDAFKFEETNPRIVQIVANTAESFSFEWTSSTNESKESSLIDGAFEFSGDFMELCALYTTGRVSEDAVLAVPHIGETLSLAQARHVAKRHDMLPEKETSDDAIATAVNARAQLRSPLPFDSFRQNNYFKWAVWVIHVLLHSDHGRVFGNYVEMVRHFRAHWDNGVYQATQSTRLYLLPHMRPALTTTQLCPGCELETCRLFRFPPLTWLINYKTLGLDSSEIQTKGNGPVFRHRAYKTFCSFYRYRERSRIPACMTLYTKLLYPGGVLRGFQEADPLQFEEEYGEYAA